MQRTLRRREPVNLSGLWKVFGFVFFAVLFLGFMVIPCFKTLTSIFTVKDAAGN